MCNEVSLSSVDLDDFDGYYRSSFSATTPPAANFHEAIFSRGNDFYHFTTSAALHRSRSDVEHRTQKVARNNGKEPMNSGASGEVRIEAKWGDKDGPSISIGASGEVHDNNGNYAKGEIKQDSESGGSVSLSAGHKKENEG